MSYIVRGNNMADPRIREVAESLLNSVNYPYARIPPHSQSVNLVSEDLVTGHRINGRMSSVRRFFCLFVTFDLLFSSLMWLICVMMKGETVEQILNREIIHYSVKKSIFDIVMAALIRFIVLLVFYAYYQINNWSVVALTTGLTTAGLIAKVFVYDWPDASQPVFQVFLILSSFTISWSEAWFLDYRVLPQEGQAKNFLESIVSHGATERAPLLGHVQAPGFQSCGETTSHYFSPIDSPESSPRRRRPTEQVILTQEQIDEYERLANEGMRKAFECIRLPDWQLDKINENNDKIESKYINEYGKVFRLTGIVDCPAYFLFNEFKDHITKLPDWNKTILKSELIKVVKTGVPAIDITYQVTEGGGNGLIKPRDFVMLRCAAPLTLDGNLDVSEPPYSYISSGVSVDVPGFPPRKDMVRGVNKVGCWYLKPVMRKNQQGKVEHKTSLQWLMACDIKISLPQIVLNRAFMTVMLDYIQYVRKYAAEAKQKGLF